ncbi:hypothetical protein ACWGE0_41045 [Lentzea sp. NPDC054927]
MMVLWRAPIVATAAAMPLTVAEVMALPAVVDIVVAGRAFGLPMSRAKFTHFSGSLGRSPQREHHGHPVQNG